MILHLALEVARTPRQIQRGLMQRPTVPDGTGMLFVFPDLQHVGFWNRDTWAPLDVTYLDPDGVVLEIRPMRSIGETAGVIERYDPGKPYRFAIETSRGWLARQGVRAGHRFRLGPFLS